MDQTLARMLAEVRALAGIEGSTNAADLGAVERWMTQHSPDAIRTLVADTMSRRRRGAPPLSSLRYFDRAFEEALAARNRVTALCGTVLAPASPAPSAAPPDPPLTPADQALRDRLQLVRDAWMKDVSGCPFPPSFEAARSVAAGAAVEAWLSAWEAWDRRGRPASLKPPDFSHFERARGVFETRMHEIEDVLTAPDPPNSS